MKLVGEVYPFRAAGLILTGLALLTVPVAAQQDVSPEHFDAKQSATPAPKPAPANNTTKRKQSSHRQNAAAPKPTSKPQESAALKTAQLQVRDSDAESSRKTFNTE